MYIYIYINIYFLIFLVFFHPMTIFKKIDVEFYLFIIIYITLYQGCQK